MQGGLYNSLLRAMERLGLADVYGRSKLPLYVMNVAYPLVDAELVRFCAGKRAVLLVEEGQPNFIEQGIASVLRQHDLQTKLVGKGQNQEPAGEALRQGPLGRPGGPFPMAGEYSPQVLHKGLRAFVGEQLPGWLPPAPPKVIPLQPMEVHARPPGLCTGCPERPVFAALKLVQRELGEHHVSADIGCHLFSILPPFHIGNTTMGYGLGAAGAAAFNTPSAKRAISIMGDGGFWHNGLTSGIANAVFNKSNNLTLIVDNNYTAATGGQDILSSRAGNRTRSTCHPIEKAVRGVGVEWVKTIRRTYDVAGMRAAIREALTTKQPGPKVIVAQSECMLNRQRREKPQVTQGHRRRPAPCARAFRRRQRHLHRRPFVHPHQRLPVVEHQAQPRPAAQRPGGHRARQLRRLRHVRRGLARRGAVPVVLPRRHRQQPDMRWDRWLAGLRAGVIAALQRRRARRLAATAF